MTKASLPVKIPFHQHTVLKSKVGEIQWNIKFGSQLSWRWNMDTSESRSNVVLEKDGEDCLKQSCEEQRGIA